MDIIFIARYANISNDAAALRLWCRARRILVLPMLD